MIHYAVGDLIGESANPMEIATYPEKFTDNITVEICADLEEHCIIVLTNQMGRVLRMLGVNVTHGKNQIHVDNLNTIEAGLYLLSVKNTKSNILFSSMLTKL